MKGPLKCINLEDFKGAIHHLKTNKAPGLDKIPGEVWMAMGNDGVVWLYNLFNKFIEGILYVILGDIAILYPSIKEKETSGIAIIIEPLN